MNFEELESAVKAIIVTASGLPAADVMWHGHANNAGMKGLGTGPGKVCYLRWLAERGMMHEVRTTFDTDTGLRQHRLVGHRRLTLDVKVESFSQLATSSARQVLDRIRTRLRHKPLKDAMRCANVGLISIGPAVNLDRIEEGRLRSVWVSDVVLCAAENDLPEEPTTGGWIETAGGDLVTGATPEDTTEF